jgi:hypothetical protein
MDARQSYATFALATLQPSPWQPGGREERGGVRPPDPLPGTAQLNVNYADRGSFDARPLHDRILVKFFSSNDFHRQLKAIVNMSPLVKLFEILVQPVWFEFECDNKPLGNCKARLASTVPNVCALKSKLFSGPVEASLKRSNA